VPESPASIENSLHAHSCLHCAARVDGRFCPDCGERRVDRHEYSFKHILETVVEGLTHFDLRIFRSFRELVVRPGWLTWEHLRGHRNPYLGPVQLFFWVNLFFFLISGYTRFDVFNTPLAVQIEQTAHRQRAQQELRNVIKNRKLSSEQVSKLVTTFDATSKVISKSLVIVMIPIFGLLFWGLMGFKRHYGEVLIFAFHFFAWLLLLLLASSYVASGLVALSVTTDWDSVASGITNLSSSLYLYFAFRRVFGSTWYWNLFRAVVSGLAIFPIIELYRFLLFEIVIRTV
jgi:hypothetical protein